MRCAESATERAHSHFDRNLGCGRKKGEEAVDFSSLGLLNTDKNEDGQQVNSCQGGKELWEYFYPEPKGRQRHAKKNYKLTDKHLLWGLTVPGCLLAGPNFALFASARWLRVCFACKEGSIGEEIPRLPARNFNWRPLKFFFVLNLRVRYRKVL